MSKKRKSFCLAGVIGVMVCLAGCGTEEAIQKEIELLSPVEAVTGVETVARRDLYTVTVKDAELAPYTEEVSFDAGGSISKLYVKLGSNVSAGDLLAELEEEGVRTKANDALDKYLSEKKVYMDAVKGARKKLGTNLTVEEREQQELVISQAEELWKMQEPGLWATWEAARDELGKNKIYAPCDGVITACLSEGSTVAEGQPVLALSDPERLYIVAGEYMEPSEYRAYKNVYAVVDGKDTEITYADELMEEKGAYTYYTAADLNGAKMGDFILICMIGDYHEQVLSVPKSAVYKDSLGNYVYLIENGVRVRKDVTTGYQSGVYVEVVEGLQEGDKVYVKN